MREAFFVWEEVEAGALVVRAETSRAGRNILRKEEGEFPAAGLMQSAEVFLEKKAMPERGQQKSWSRELSLQTKSALLMKIQTELRRFC